MFRTLVFAMFAFGFAAAMLSNCASRSKMNSSPDMFESRASAARYSDSGRPSLARGTTTTSEGMVELQRDSDGHFYADLQVNGATIRALVDTGASQIALTRADASSAGVGISIGMPEVVGEGAGGAVHGEIVRLERVALGHKSAEAVHAVVLDGGGQSLLGQSFLSKFDSVEIRGDTMVLK